MNSSKTMTATRSTVSGVDSFLDAVPTKMLSAIQDQNSGSSRTVTGAAQPKVTSSPSNREALEQYASSRQEELHRAETARPDTTLDFPQDAYPTRAAYCPDEDNESPRWQLGISVDTRDGKPTSTLTAAFARDTSKIRVTERGTQPHLIGFKDPPSILNCNPSLASGLARLPKQESEPPKFHIIAVSGDKNLEGVEVMQYNCNTTLYMGDTLPFSIAYSGKSYDKVEALPLFKPVSYCQNATEEKTWVIPQGIPTLGYYLFDKYQSEDLLRVNSELSGEIMNQNSQPKACYVNSSGLVQPTANYNLSTVPMHDMLSLTRKSQVESGLFTGIQLLAFGAASLTYLLASRRQRAMQPANPQQIAA